ncbi:MAG: response regulator [Armatimonadota bacterium]
MRILVVDDEQGIRELIRDILEPRGHKVTCASGGTEALALLARQPVDMMYLDIRMPNGDGLSVLKRLQVEHPNLPVIMITGCAQHEIVDETLDLGAFACLVKPFCVGDVLGMLDVIRAAA